METGALKNIVLGFSDFEDYYKNNLCACQSIGRVAGRIGKASYTHNMVLYSLPKNEETTAYMAVQKECRFKIGTMSQT